MVRCPKCGEPMLRLKTVDACESCSHFEYYSPKGKKRKPKPREPE